MVGIQRAGASKAQAGARTDRDRGLLCYRMLQVSIHELQTADGNQGIFKLSKKADGTSFTCRLMRSCHRLSLPALAPHWTTMSGVNPSVFRRCGTPYPHVPTTPPGPGGSC